MCNSEENPAARPAAWKEAVFRVAAVVVALLALEGALHALGLPEHDYCWITKEDFWVEDPELGFTYRPGAQVVDATINPLGLRGPLVPDPKPPGTTRLLFVGDSTCFGLGVTLGQSFAARTAEKLAETHPDRRVDYVIGAIPGYSSYHNRVLLPRLLPLEPDLVVFYVGAHNDHSRARYYRDGEIPERLARREEAWHDVRVLHALEVLRDLTWRKWWRKLHPDWRQARVLPDEFEANMRAMLAASEAAGARSLVLLPPVSDALLEDHPMIPRYQDALRRVAADRGAAQLALQPHFAPHPPRKVYFADLYHMSRHGHRVAAEAIVEAIRSHGALPGSEGQSPSTSRVRSSSSL